MEITDFKNGLDGADLLRDAVRFINSRNEFLNENKTPIELLNDFLKAK